jgi:hypothetical protein
MPLILFGHRHASDYRRRNPGIRDLSGRGQKIRGHHRMVAQLRPDGRPTGLTVRKLPVNISWTPRGLPEALCAARARLKARFEWPLCTDDQPGLSRWRNNSRVVASRSPHRSHCGTALGSPGFTDIAVCETAVAVRVSHVKRASRTTVAPSRIRELCCPHDRGALWWNAWPMTRSLLPPCFRRSSVTVRASTTNRHRVCRSSPDRAISPRRVHCGPESLVFPLPVHRPSGRIS